MILLILRLPVAFRGIGSGVLPLRPMLVCSIDLLVVVDSKVGRVNRCHQTAEQGVVNGLIRVGVVGMGQPDNARFRDS